MADLLLPPRDRSDPPVEARDEVGELERPDGLLDDVGLGHQPDEGEPATQRHV